MKEEWKDIPEYKGLYQVSNLGRVRSLDRFVNTRGGGLQPKKGMILKLKKNRGGYLFYLFSKDGERKSITIHRLVMRIFIGESNLQVNHIDGDRTNNRLSNLEYCTHLENMSHRETVLKDKKKYGIHFHKRDRKWYSQIMIKGKLKHLGVFADKEDAYNSFYNKYYEVYGKYPW